MKFYKDSSRFEGTFEEGQRVKGKHTWSNGTVYEGNFKRDKFNGRAQLTFPNGNLYIGNFCDGYFCNFRDPEEGSCKFFLKDKFTEHPRNKNSFELPFENPGKVIDDQKAA